MKGGAQWSHASQLHLHVKIAGGRPVGEQTVPAQTPSLAEAYLMIED